MKTKVGILFVVIVLLTSVRAPGQNLTNLVNFNGANGANPQSPLLLSGNTLYGTTFDGGAYNSGVVFAYNIATKVYTNLYNFTGSNDGRGPQGNLVLSGNLLYGTTELGGSNGNGAVYAVQTNGGYVPVYSFLGGNDGADPEAGLVLAGNLLYGTTFIGGESGLGTVFVVNTNGTFFSNLWSFSGGINGANPEANLLLSGGTLYGTTWGPETGGGPGFGTVFSINTNGGSFSNLYNFTNGVDGANPAAGLILVGNALYGTAYNGGDYLGTVFQINTNGSGFVSYAFNGTNGANPQANLIASGSELYGTTVNGGSPGWGTVFTLNLNGNNFTNLYAFTDAEDGSNPEAGLVLSGNILYGTTQGLNDYGYEGTVFLLTAPTVISPIPLSISLSGNQVTLTWSNASFLLQSTSNLTIPFTNVPGASSPFTTNASGTQQFYRLQE